MPSPLRCLALVTILASACTQTEAKKDDPKVRKTATGGANALPEKESCLGIVNGALSHAHPSVVMITRKDNVGLYTCTATFVGPNVLLTAAHCIADKPDGGVAYVKGDQFQLSADPAQQTKFFKGGIRPKRAIYQGTDFMVEPGEKPPHPKESYRDLAILIFDADIAPAVTPIHRGDVEDGSDIVMVGFGVTGLEALKGGENHETTRKKRTGKNGVTKVPKSFGSRVWVIVGPDEERNAGKKMSMGAPGDSGGPILFQGETIGVASEVVVLESSGLEGKAAGVYADLSDPFAQKLIEQAKAQGAKFATAGTSGGKACAP